MSLDEMHTNLSLEETLEAHIFTNARPIIVLDNFDTRPLEILFNGGSSTTPHGEIVRHTIPAPISTSTAYLEDDKIEGTLKNLSVPEVLTRSAISYANALVKQFDAMVTNGLKESVVTISAISIPDTFEVGDDHPLWKAVRDLRHIIHYMQRLGIDIVVAEGNFPTKHNFAYSRNAIKLFLPSRPFNIFTPIPEVFHVGGVQFEDGGYHLMGLPANIDVWAYGETSYCNAVHVGNSFAAPRAATTLSLFYAIYPELNEMDSTRRHEVIGQMLAKCTHTIDKAMAYDAHRRIDDSCGIYYPRTLYNVPVLSEKKLVEFLSAGHINL